VTRDEAIRILVDYATGKAWHRYNGADALCPDGIDHDTRDPECEVCQAIGVMEQAPVSDTIPAPCPADRGVLINRKASAGSALVKAQEALRETERAARQHPTSEMHAAAEAVARGRAEQARWNYRDATIELDAVGGP
jgi:hypothetical protein